MRDATGRTIKKGDKIIYGTTGDIQCVNAAEVLTDTARWPFNRCSKETRMRAYIEATESIEYRPAKQMSLFRCAL